MTTEAKKRVKGLRPLRRSRGGVSPWQGTGTASLLRAAAPGSWRLSRIREDSRNSSLSPKKAAPSLPLEGKVAERMRGRMRWKPDAPCSSEYTAIRPCCLVLCELSFVMPLLSRSRERSKEGQRGCRISHHRPSPPLDSPRLSMLAVACSCTPAQRPRGGVPLLVLSFAGRCAAPLYGVAALPVLRAPLWELRVQ